MKHNKSLDDPWGAFDEDEYAVPTEVTGADSEDDNDERRRRAGDAMALRGSGTRGRKKGGGTGGMPPGMMPGGAGGGGAGAPAAGGVAPQPAMSQPMMSAGPGGAAGMPSVMPGAQMGRMGGSSLYAPAGANAPLAPAGPGAAPVPSAGLMAAGADDPVDAETMREALQRSGLDQSVTVDSDGRIITDPLVDTDGDGIPDTPRSQVAGPGETTPGSDSPYPGADSGPGAPTPSNPDPGYPGPVTPSPVTPSPTTPSPRDDWYTSPDPTNPSDPSNPTDPGNQTGPSVPSNPSNPSPYDPSYPTPNPGGPRPGTEIGSPTPGRRDDSGMRYTPPSSPPSSSSAGYRPADFTYNAGDLHNEAGRWSDLADRSKPMQNMMMSTPDPNAMFGVMTQVVSPYRAAVETSVEAAEDAGLEAEAHAMALSAASKKYQENEAQAQQHAGGMNS